MSLIMICLSISYKRLNFKRDKNLEFDFRDYKSLKESFKDIYYKTFTIEEAERMQNEFDSVVNALEEYSPKNLEYEKEKINLLNNAEKFYDGREMIINVFKNTTFPFQHDESRFEDEDEDDIKDKNSLTDYKKLDRLIFLKEWDTNNELVRKTL